MKTICTYRDITGYVTPYKQKKIPRTGRRLDDGRRSPNRSCMDNNPQLRGTSPYQPLLLFSLLTLLFLLPLPSFLPYLSSLIIIIIIIPFSLSLAVTPFVSFGSLILIYLLYGLPYLSALSLYDISANS